MKRRMLPSLADIQLCVHEHKATHLVVLRSPTVNLSSTSQAAIIFHTYRTRMHYTLFFFVQVYTNDVCSRKPSWGKPQNSPPSFAALTLVCDPRDLHTCEIFSEQQVYRKHSESSVDTQVRLKERNLKIAGELYIHIAKKKKIIAPYSRVSFILQVYKVDVRFLGKYMHQSFSIIDHFRRTYVFGPNLWQRSYCSTRYSQYPDFRTVNKYKFFLQFKMTRISVPFFYKF